MGKVLSALYLFYAALIFILLMFIALPFVLLATALLAPATGKRVGMFFLRCWAWGFSLTTFFWVKTTNKHLINREVPHIYVGNHGSYLDAIAVCISVPQYFSPLGKIEMAKVPVFGWIYKRIVVMIDRSSKESRERSVAALKRDIANGQSILIFPEGTMNKSDAPLSEFYDGAFKIAIETQTPLMPFVMINNKKLLPRVHPLKAHPGLLTTVFITPVDVKGLQLEDLAMLKQKVYTLMEEAILKYS
ncbi:1-acyl-sn-glycerol-3-phosphate acyltransferase [Pedobacter sp. LMG 31464]|uniref:1-acyl-sn-glycerol-3-phosphate acyltransferase n=1 Tax=Pedobacter planticolens TaxID=2679964 RepID=A0A923E0E0_9SPHI|nr:lysophospholipid acyltransferase family protein [Pedobacter planticolens]MBB2146108.1 1-acyl-sn-glycerol-3-phosphate acyltransferase [Pedobacter planticolens]